MDLVVRKRTLEHRRSDQPGSAVSLSTVFSISKRIPLYHLNQRKVPFRIVHDFSQIYVHRYDFARQGFNYEFTRAKNKLMRKCDSNLRPLVRNSAKIRNRYNQEPHLNQDTNGKVITSQKTSQTRARGQPFTSR